MSRRLACMLAACTVMGLTLVPAGPADASTTQTVYFEAPRDLLNPQTRPAALSTLASLGVHALRVVVYWQDVAPAADASTRPSFDATNPANYSWGQYDALLAAAAQRQWQVLLTVSGPVPRWATSSRRDHLTRPSPAEFGQFMTAIGRHYAKQVSVWSIWNEPNHPQYLDPQYVNHHAVSPRIYRALFQAGVDGLHAAGLTGAHVLMGETAPRGTGHDVAPLTFLRGALCLNAHYRKASSCSALPADGYAHHAYTTTAGPFFRPPGPNDVTIGVLSRLTRALDAAARAHALPHRVGIYLTEFGIQSKPNPFLGVPLAQQAEFQEISEHIAWSNPHVVAFSQYLLRDDPEISRPGSAAQGTGSIGFQSGLELADGRPKPSLAGFRLPLVVRRRGHRASLWGLVRPATQATSVIVQYVDRHSRRWRSLKTLTTAADGHWTARSPLRSGRRWRVLWTAPGGTLYTGPAIRAY